MEEYIDEINKDEIDSPNRKETAGGLILGLIYLFVLPSILYALIQGFLGWTTLKELNIYMIAAEIASALITAFAMFTLCKRNFKYLLKSFQNIKIGTAAKYMFYVLIAGVIYNYLLVILELSPETNANQAALNEAFAYAPVLTVIYTCICAPVLEELIFRYFIYKPVSKKNKILAVILSGVSFGFIHMISTLVSFIDTKDTATLINDLISLPNYIIAGVIFATAYNNTNKISTSIVAHAIYNTFAVISLFMTTSQAPFIYNDCLVENDSIKITYTINSELNTHIDKFEIYELNTNDKSKVLIKTYDNIITDQLDLNSLKENTVYYITATYTYDSTDISLNIERVQEELTYYAKTR